jgi:cell division protein FtsI/penicillin-binding protein 2
MIWWDQLLYGMSPQGLDVRLSIDLSLQTRADKRLGNNPGAVILLNAQTGEILVMASHPTFDSNTLNEIGSKLNDDPGKPLINRATLGLYPAGAIFDPFVQMLFGDRNPNKEELQKMYSAFGFDRAPEIEMQVAGGISNTELDQLHVSPLQMALAGATLSNHGTIPAPMIATAVNTPRDGWVVLSAEGTPFEAVQPSVADEAAESLIEEGNSYWSYTGQATEKDTSVTWFIAGTPPNWQASPLVVVVLLEKDNVYLAQKIGQELLAGAMNP